MSGTGSKILGSSLTGILFLVLCLVAGTLSAQVPAAEGHADSSMTDPADVPRDAPRPIEVDEPTPIEEPVEAAEPDAAAGEELELLDFDALNEVSGISSFYHCALTEVNAEPVGYGAYTYVLVNLTPEALAEEGNALQSRYFGLIGAIRNAAFALTDDTPATSRINVFVIPLYSVGNLGVGARITGHILSALADGTADAELKTRLALNPGPFLVTLPQPLGDGSKVPKAAIYMDLTRAHPDAMNDVVRKYKSVLVRKKLTGISRIRSFHLSLLNAMLGLNDDVHMVSVTASSWFKDR